jgi:hypothetical protein
MKESLTKLSLSLSPHLVSGTRTSMGGFPCKGCGLGVSNRTNSTYSKLQANSKLRASPSAPGSGLWALGHKPQSPSVIGGYTWWLHIVYTNAVNMEPHGSQGILVRKQRPKPLPPPCCCCCSCLSNHPLPPLFSPISMSSYHLLPSMPSSHPSLRIRVVVFYKACSLGHQLLGPTSCCHCPKNCSYRNFFSHRLDRGNRLEIRSFV